MAELDIYKMRAHPAIRAAVAQGLQAVLDGWRARHSIEAITGEIDTLPDIFEDLAVGVAEIDDALVDLTIIAICHHVNNTAPEDTNDNSTPDNNPDP